MNNQWFGFSFENKRMANRGAKAFEERALTIKRSQFEKRVNDWNTYCTIYMVYALNPGMDEKAFADKCNRIYEQSK